MKPQSVQMRGLARLCFNHRILPHCVQDVQAPPAAGHLGYDDLDLMGSAVAPNGADQTVMGAAHSTSRPLAPAAPLPTPAGGAAAPHLPASFPADTASRPVYPHIYPEVPREPSTHHQQQHAVGPLHHLPGPPIEIPTQPPPVPGDGCISIAVGAAIKVPGAVSTGLPGA